MTSRLLPEVDALRTFAVMMDKGDDRPVHRHGRLRHIHTEQGDPSQHLLEHSKGAELLVLGNHGRGAFAGAMLGSVAQRSAQHSRCPVVLVPSADAVEP